MFYIGVVTYVSHMSALQCCFTTQDKYTAELNSLVLLYEIESLFGEQEVYVSYDGGFTYTIFYVASTTMFYFRNTENWATSQLSESFPLRDPLYMLEVILVAGLRGHLIVWSPQMLLYSPDDAGNGAIAVVTSDGGLYYGRLGLKAVVVKQQLTQTSAPVISCPVERFSGDFDGKLFYIDKGDSLKLSLDYVPTPNCPFFPVVTLTNADALDTQELIVMDGTTPDGYKTFIMIELEEKGLVTISVDLMEREVSCNTVNPQKVHVIMACPPGKHIQVMREVYDPDLLFRSNKAERDLTVKYSYFHHMCPLLVYYDMPWKPTFELWDGDTFVEVVKADFVMYEAHGMHNYKYLQTAKTAKCVSQPQNWISMLQKTPYIYRAWSKQNYRSCKDYNGPPLTNPDAEYQVLSQNSRNKIVFSNYNGMYLFTAVVVDPDYSFCTLTTTFTVYVYGAFPKRILPYGVLKLDKLGFSTSLCNWLLDFLLQRPQAVCVGNNTSSTLTLSTGAPQGCVLSPLLFTLLTHDYTTTHSSNHLVKFADDTTLVGLITKGDEAHYREEVDLLAKWCKDNSLLLNVTSLAKKAQQRLYFLRKLKKASATPPVMTTFYRGTIQSIVSSCITLFTLWIYELIEDILPTDPCSERLKMESNEEGFII
ncbi:cation channel sperm-associated auxiliary subunit delta-like [Alosa pseudoharengus]|uniref:cation channel sperm-associated auxiliary subunit delta-like n=1 Tax=Alosa pseudoharengus TaxID=34774 RepID=UPI003F894DA0